MTTTPIGWPHVPRNPSGDWGVTLPGNASIGEVKLWAKGHPVAIFDTPFAPVGTTFSVATTYVVPAFWIYPDGLSLIMPGSDPMTVKCLFSCSVTPQSAADALYWQNIMFCDDHNDGTYGELSWRTDLTSLVTGWTWYGPGDTTSDGLVLPADTAAIYTTIQAPEEIRFGPYPIWTELSTATLAGGGGTPRTYWTHTDTTAPPLRNLQRIDDVATHVLPLIPDRLP
jgi:hypothetical protein